MAEIRNGYVPGIIGRCAELHGTLYAREWGFGLSFEAMVAAELASFARDYVDGADGWWCVVADGRIEGHIALQRAPLHGQIAHLRWFVVSPALRGTGLGRQLLAQAVNLGQRSGAAGIELATFRGLDAARHLYEQAGFRLVDERAGNTWGREVTEQRFHLDFRDTASP